MQCIMLYKYYIFIEFIHISIVSRYVIDFITTKKNLTTSEKLEYFHTRLCTSKLIELFRGIHMPFTYNYTLGMRHAGRVLAPRDILKF